MGAAAVAASASAGGSISIASANSTSQFVVRGPALSQVSTNLSQQQAVTRLLRDVSISQARLPEQ